MNDVQLTDVEQLIELPTQPHKPKVNPQSMIIVGKEKSGKTTALAKLPNCLIIDTEKGSEMVEAVALHVPQNVGPVGKMNWLKKLAKQLKEHPHNYKYIALDTFTEVDEWSEWSGTWRYMQSPQGKSFNREKNEKGQVISKDAYIDPDSDEYQSVHTLAEGYGYRWSRQEVMDVFDLFMTIPGIECVIFVCHIEDKYLAQNDATAVKEEQLALTGKIKKMLPRKVDAIGYIYNDKGTIKITFSTNEEKIGGTRAQHLKGFNGPLDWTKVFI
jgi:hypothetical protein